MKTVIQNLLLLSLLGCCCTISSCKKESTEVKPDFREHFTGDFEFTIMKESWSDAMPDNIYDTTTFAGSIRLYSSTDNEHDLYFGTDNPAENPMAYITIKFLQAQRGHITSVVSEAGLLEEKLGHRYSHEGTFLGSDSLRFEVRGLGGIGGGTNYEVIGVRR